MKGVLKVSKEQVIEIERYCDEHGITRKQRIDELGLSHTAYYYTRGLLSEEELHGGQFTPIMSGSGLMQTASMPVGRSRRKQASVHGKRFNTHGELHCMEMTISKDPVAGKPSRGWSHWRHGRP